MPCMQNSYQPECFRVVHPLEDARDTSKAGLSEPRNAQSTFEHPEGGTVYKPKSIYMSAGNGPHIGQPQEYQSRVQVSNLGFLDRDRTTGRS